MLLKETLKIIEKLMTELDVSDFKVSDARVWLHVKETEDDAEDIEIENEYDILIEPTVTHWQIQQIDRLLSDYDNVEMWVESEGLRIFEKEA